MKNILYAFLVMIIGGFSVLAQDDSSQKKPSMDTHFLKYTFPVGQSVTYHSTHTFEENGSLFKINDVSKVTYQSVKGDQHLYYYKPQKVEVVSVKGLPAGFDKFIKEFAEAAMKAPYQYKADSSGFPIEVSDEKAVRKLTKNINKSLKKWIKTFAKKEKMSRDQRKTFESMLSKMMEESFPKDGTKMSNLMLEGLRHVFLPTHRELYLNYQTEFEGTIYMEEINQFFHTIDTFEVEEINEDKGYATLYYWSKIKPEGFDLFLRNVRGNLEKQKHTALDIEKVLNVWKALVLATEGRVTLDLETGVPVSGVLKSTKEFQGSKEVYTHEFSSDKAP